MNGKKAKLLRKQAQELTVGREPVAYMQQQNQRHNDFMNIQLRPGCTRNYCQRIKKDYLKSIRT